MLAGGLLASVSPAGAYDGDIFYAARLYSTVSDPSGLDVADFNGDGIPDLVTVHGPDSDIADQVAVLLGDGDGGFGSPITSDIYLQRLVRVTAADFNSDGKMDIAASHEWADYVSVWLGNGDGTFASPILRSVPSSFYPGTYGIASGDMNGDTIRDIVTGTFYGQQIGVSLGHGDGHFDPMMTFPIYYEGSDKLVYDVAVGDLNGDAKLDVVAARSDSIVVVLGNGDGTLGTKRSYATGAYNYTVAIGDWTGDHVPDIITSAVILRGIGDGTFAFYPAPSGGGGRGVAVADLDGDGKIDRATTGGSNVQITLNATGSGQTLVSGSSPRAVKLADLDGDGDLDLVSLNLQGPTSATLSREITVRHGFGDGTFETSFSFADGHSSALRIAVADLNGDDNPDVLCSGWARLGDGAGGLGDPIPVGGGRVAAIGDLDGDAHPDAAMASSSGLVRTFKGAGDGTFTQIASFSGLGTGLDIAIGDVTGDGLSDVVTLTSRVIESNPNRPVRYEVNVYPGDGAEGVGSPITTTVAKNAAMIALWHFDGDAGLDVAVSGDQIEVVRSTGVLSILQSTAYGNVMSGDVNGDGYDDVVVTNPGVKAMLGHGNGTVTLMPPGSGSGVALADLDRDGVLDLVGAPSFQKGLGDGTFAAPSSPRYLVDGGDGPAAVGDMNGDGWPDVVIVGADMTSIVVSRGESLLVSVPHDVNTVPERTWLAILGAMPNPARGRLVLSIALPSAAPARLEMFDPAGRRVRSLALEARAGTRTVEMGRPELGPGIYFARLSQAGHAVSKRVIVID